MTTVTAERYDVAVVGTGPVGLAAACRLARAGLRICLVGPSAPPGTGRTAALLAGSVDLMREIGAWNAIGAEAGALRSLRIVDDTGSLFRPPPVLFRADEIGLDAFGWNVENARLAAILSGSVDGHREITRVDALVEGFEAKANGARLRCVDGRVVEAELVVAADGRRSAVRQAAGVAVRERRYPQTAFTIILGHERDHGEVSTEFHTRAGPFTLVPLPGRRSSLVWVTGHHHAARLASADDAALSESIGRQSHAILGRVWPDGPRGVVPLSSLTVDRLVAPRLMLAGEAAHVLPPIGAQGLNLGFADVRAIGRAVDDALRLGRGLADPATLDAYSRERAGDVRLRSAAVDGLNRSLLAGFWPIDAARGLGLGLLGQIGPLRRFAMRAGLPRSEQPVSRGTERAAARPS